MFNISVTGINAAQKYLDVTSNNIANAETYGFKYSRAEFADIYSQSVFANSKTASGYGTYTTTVSQQFAQGSLSGDTGNALDMAILGNGFFVLSSSNTDVGSSYDLTYTRNGAFELDSEGYLVTATGEYVMGYQIDEDGNVTNLDLNSTIAIQIPENTGAPQMSTEVTIGVQLPANSDVVTLESFDSQDSSTYTASTSQTIYDSLGNTHTLTYYYLNLGYGADLDGDGVGDEDTATWAVICYVDGNPVDIASVPEVDDGDDIYDGTDDGTCKPISFTISDSNSSDYENTYTCFIMEFNTSGNMTNMYPPAVYLANAGSVYTYDRADDEYTDADNVDANGDPDPEANGNLNYAMGGGVDDSQMIHIEMTATQYGSSAFTISSTAATDGYAMGYLTGVEVSEDGIIQCTYSNGQVKDLCMIALATFTNEQGLTKVGDTQWKASISSGEASPAQANVGVAGSIKGSNLELSNVDLTAQLVELIVAQRYYQCNAQSLQTQNNVMDAILSI